MCLLDSMRTVGSLSTYHKMSPLANSLPRLSNELDIIVIRKGTADSHRNFHVRQSVVLHALQWLIYYNSCTHKIQFIIRLAPHAFSICLVIIQWYCGYHPVLSFDVWLHWNINILYKHVNAHTSHFAAKTALGYKPMPSRRHGACSIRESSRL